jgi:hypothetical protein
MTPRKRYRSDLTEAQWQRIKGRYPKQERPEGRAATSVRPSTASCMFYGQITVGKIYRMTLALKGMTANRLDKPSVVGALSQLFLIAKITSLCRVAVPPKTACKAVIHASAGRSNALLPGRIAFDDWTVCLSMDRKRIVLLSELFSSNTTSRVLPIQAASGSCKSLICLASSFLLYFLGATPQSASTAKLLACWSR